MRTYAWSHWTRGIPSGRTLLLPWPLCQFLCYIPCLCAQQWLVPVWNGRCLLRFWNNALLFCFLTRCHLRVWAAPLPSLGREGPAGATHGGPRKAFPGKPWAGDSCFPYFLLCLWHSYTRLYVHLECIIVCFTHFKMNQVYV